MKTKDIGLILAGVAVYMLITQNQKRYNTYQNYPTVPPQPPRNNAQAWQQWVQTIIGTYGMVAELWQPGGPFYQVPQSQVQQALGSGATAAATAAAQAFGNTI